MNSSLEVVEGLERGALDLQDLILKNLDLLILTVSCPHCCARRKFSEDELYQPAVEEELSSLCLCHGPLPDPRLEVHDSQLVGALDEVGPTSES